MTAGELAAWGAAALGSPVVTELFVAGHFSNVLGAALADGRRVVMKARPVAARLEACCGLQRALTRASFPCPELLAGPERRGERLLTAERLIEGCPEPPTPSSIRPAAALLHDLVVSAPAVGACGSLAPPPPWVHWDHPGSGTWPSPDDLNADLNAGDGQSWPDECGRRLRERLAAARLPDVVAHLDWEAHNLLWCDGRPTAVLDWDSAAERPEAAVAGAAAAVFASLGPTVAASLEQSERFLACYEGARGEPFTAGEREVAWAAGTWVLAFNARKEAEGAPEGPYQRALAAEGAARLRRAGVPA